jgi:Fe-S cluster assembly iron-binding protein IscA
VPIARSDGVTLHAPAEQAALLTGLSLDYRGDLSGGGFLVRSAGAVRTCACGAAFSPLAGKGLTTR